MKVLRRVVAAALIAAPAFVVGFALGAWRHHERECVPVAERIRELAEHLRELEQPASLRPRGYKWPVRAALPAGGWPTDGESAEATARRARDAEAALRALEAQGLTLDD